MVRSHDVQDLRSHLYCGRFDKEHKLWKYFTKFSIPEEDFNFFLNNPCPPDIFGFNHYLTSERFLDHRTQLYPPHTHGGNHRHSYADVEAVRVELDEPTGIEVLLKEAWERYKKTNCYYRGALALYP